MLKQKARVVGSGTVIGLNHGNEPLRLASHRGTEAFKGKDHVTQKRQYDTLSLKGERHVQGI